MTALGDVFLKEDWSLQDREFIRLEMNKLQTQVSSLSAWMAPGGNLDPDLFQKHATSFSVLPHECAAMYNGSPQTIGDSSWTTLTHDSTSTATWNRGMKIDPATGFIYVAGIPRETVLFIVTWARFVPNATGERHISWNSNDAGVRYKVFQNRGAGEFDSVDMELTHGRKIASAQTHYFTQVYQDSGGNLDVDDFGFFIARLR